MPKLSKPTTKMEVFAHQYVKTGFDRKKAVRLANYNVKGDKQADSLASEYLQKPMIKELVQQELDKAGLTSSYTDLKLRKLIEHGEKNIDQTKPETMLAAIRLVNELRNRFPAQRSLIASIDLTKEYANTSIEELKQEVQETDKHIKQLLKQIDSTSNKEIEEAKVD